MVDAHKGRLHPPGARDGFTLLELVIVMLLAGLILGLATIQFATSLPSARLSATGRDISATIRQMRFLAQNRGEDLILTLDLDARQYGVEGLRMKPIPANIGLKVLDPAYGEVFNGKYPIFFHSTGGVEGGTVVLSYKKKAVYIEMDPVMGSVKIRQ